MSDSTPHLELVAVVRDALVGLYHYTADGHMKKGRSEVYADGMEALRSLEEQLQAWQLWGATDVARARGLAQALSEARYAEIGEQYKASRSIAAEIQKLLSVRRRERLRSHTL